MSTLHNNLTADSWSQLTLYEQMGNIGSEVGRAFRYFQKADTVRLDGAIGRALELFDLTINVSAKRPHLKEITRAREVFLDALSEKPQFSPNLAEIEKYFYQFAVAARLQR